MDDNEGRAPLRVLLAVGDPERERLLRDALSASGLTVAGRCLDGASLADRAGSFDYDVALASSALHRLSPATLTAIRESRLPVVLLVPPTDLDRYSDLAHLMPADSGAAEVATAVQEAWARGASYAPHRSRSRGTVDGPGEMERIDTAKGRVIAVVSGKGAPGVTTVAIGLSAALAESQNTCVLVDADLRGGNVAAYLDLDPRRGLVGLPYAPFESLGARIEEELQEAAGFSVLAGIERSYSRSKISADLVLTLMPILKSRFDYVVVDAGEALSWMSARATEAVLRSAKSGLLVTRNDLISIWNARACLHHLRQGLGLDSERVQVVINGRGGHSGYDAGAVQAALSAPVLTTLPEDRRAVNMAIERQLPVTVSGGRLARELRSLARRLAAEPTEVAREHPGLGSHLHRASAENA